MAAQPTTVLLLLIVLSGLASEGLSLIISCKEVDSIDIHTEANSEILYFWDCASRNKCRGKIIRYQGEKYWSCTTKEPTVYSSTTTTAATETTAAANLTTPSGTVEIDLGLCMDDFSIYHTSSGCFYLNPLHVVAYNDQDVCQGKRKASGTFVNLDEPDMEVLSLRPGYGHEYWLAVRYINGSYTWLASNESFPEPSGGGEANITTTQAQATEAPTVVTTETNSTSGETTAAATVMLSNGQSNETTSMGGTASNETTAATTVSNETTAATSSNQTDSGNQTISVTVEQNKAAVVTTETILKSATTTEDEEDENIIPNCIADIKTNIINILCADSNFLCELYH